MPKNVKNTTYPNFLELIAPYTCKGCGKIGSAVCERCKNYIISHHINFCPQCKTNLPKTSKCPKCQNLPPTHIIDERQSLIGELIHDYKYQSVRSLAHPLAEILHETLPEYKNQVVIVPLPTIDKHIRERGLDHTYLIAKQLTKIRGKNYHVKRIIKRNKNTIQVGSSRTSRKTQARAAYQIDQKYNLDQDTTYLLLDDVWTTGASMLSATKKLQQAGAKNIELVILAVSRLD